MKPFLLLIILLIFTSCSTRYSHVPKGKATEYKKTERPQIEKKVLLKQETIAQKQPVIIFEKTEHLVEIIEVPKLEVSQPNDHVHTYRNKAQKISVEPTPSDTTKPKVYPEVSKIKMGQKNLVEVLLTIVFLSFLAFGILMLIFTIVGLIFTILFFLASFVDAMNLFVAMLIGSATYFVGALMFLSFSIADFLYERVYKKLKFRVGNEKYTLLDFKAFPKKSKIKRTAHNLLIIAILTIIIPLVLLVLSAPVNPIAWLTFSAFLWPLYLTFLYFLFKLIYLFIWG